MAAPDVPSDDVPSGTAALWRDVRTRLAAAGLNHAWVVPRSAIEPVFRDAPPPATAPSLLRPDYRNAIVLASSGTALWQACGAEAAAASDPVDAHCELSVDAACKALRGADPAAIAVYPFRHDRQLLGFTRLLGRPAWLASAPFGVTVHPELGPWWALRGAILTALDLPAAPLEAPSPCTDCPAPCVAACPAGAVGKVGLDWNACTDYRLGALPCRETCLARMACPVGTTHRYDEAAIAHHHRASLRELEDMRERAGQ